MITPAEYEIVVAYPNGVVEAQILYASSVLTAFFFAKAILGNKEGKVSVSGISEGDLRRTVASLNGVKND